MKRKEDEKTAKPEASVKIWWTGYCNLVDANFRSNGNVNANGRNQRKRGQASVEQGINNKLELQQGCPITQACRTFKLK